MRDAVPLTGRQLGGAEVHAAVLLHGVGVDHFDADLAAQPVGDGERELGFAGAGGADDRDRPRGRRHGVQVPTK